MSTGKEIILRPEDMMGNSPTIFPFYLSSEIPQEMLHDSEKREKGTIERCSKVLRNLVYAVTGPDGTTIRVKDLENMKH